MNPEVAPALEPETPAVPHQPLRPARSDAELGAALDRAVQRLRDLQRPDGWWKGWLETNVTMDAEDLLLREFLGIRDDLASARAATWIRSQQRGDGSWSLFRGGPADVSTTVEGYVALRFAGDPPDAAHMLAAAEVVRD